MFIYFNKYREEGKILKKTRFLSICLMIIIIISITGCTIVDDGLVKFGLRNQDFEYIKDNKVDRIIIQSARDTGFRFVVTDANAINDIYETLRKGKVEEEKTSLAPDYIFEIHIGEEIRYYNYVAYLDESGVGNFYDDNSSFGISKNLDETILQNLSFIRKPRDFDNIYYKSILMVLEAKKSELTSPDNKVGVDIAGDLDCLKYMFSVELENFKKNLDETVSNTTLIENNKEEFNTIITVKNKGYSSKVFKTTITVDNRKDKVYETYYIEGSYEYKDWKIKISEPNKKPNEW